MKSKIVLIGGGGHCKVIINTIKKLNSFEIIGYTDNTNKGILLGVKYLGKDSVLTDIIKKYKNCNAVIGVGGVKITNKRQEIYKKLKEMEFELPVIISKEAIVSEEVSVGEGTVILEDAIINVSSQIGKCVIINNGAIIEHDCVINNFAHLTPMTRISSGVNIGNNAFIGSGAIISKNRIVLDDCFIGAGAVLVDDTATKGLYLGVPAILKN